MACSKHKHFTRMCSACMAELGVPSYPEQLKQARERKLKLILPIYRPAEDGGMIQFGPHCAFSVDVVRGWVKGSGPITKARFNEWIDDLREFWGNDKEER